MGNDAGERRRVAELLRQNALYCDTDTFEDFYMSLNNIMFGDTGLQRSDAEIFECLAGLIETDEDTSDGYHTFGQLYYQRMMLFAVLVNEHKAHSWKTRRHEDGKPCFGGGWFLVTIETPAGAYGYHYEDRYWDLFDCEELPKAKPWDGYDESDVGRLMSLAAGCDSR